MTTPYNLRNQLERSGEAKRQEILDPGSGGTVRFKPFDLSVLKITTAGTRTFEAATLLPLGNSVIVTSSVAAAVISASSVSYTINAGEYIEFVVVLNSSEVNVWGVRTNSAVMSQTALKVVTIPQQTWKKGTDLAVNLGAATTAILGLVTGTVGTDNPYLQTNLATGSVTQKALTMIQVPADYQAGSALTFRIPWTTTVAPTTSADLDAVVYRAVAPTVDINDVTAAVDVKTAGSGTANFVLTATNVVPGELLYVQLSIAIVSGAASTDIRLSPMSLVYTV